MVIKRRRWVIVTIAVVGLLVAALVSMATRVPFSSDKLRSRVVAALADALDAEVQLETLTVRIYPRLHAEGSGLTVRHKRRQDVPPLISVAKFKVDADLLGLWRRHVARLNLEGLDLQVPPHDDAEDQENPGKDAANGKRDAAGHGIVIDELVADKAQLTILRKDQTKAPRVWYMHELHVKSVGAAEKMPFRTILTNAVPPGQINTSGTFGPWHVDDPGRSPLDGAFTFKNADLSVFNGISGILSAQGSYSGTLERIVVDGQTDTPDFMVNLSGHPVPLKTTYHAIVDATNGNTTLDPVNASFLNTSLVAKGGVYDAKDVDGRIITLDVNMDNARLEDVMRLAVKTPQPPMAGVLRLQTKLVIPPGDADVVRKLELDGRFDISRGRFTDQGVQTRVTELSLRASGKPTKKDEPPQPPPRITSDFTGRFVLKHGMLSLPSVTFDVPGALVALGGRYGLEPGTIDFKGNLYMDAKISETTTGFKSVLLKVVDPLFRKEGKTVIPLKIDGTRADPHFGLDVKRVFNRGDQKDTGAPQPVATKGTLPKKK